MGKNGNKFVVFKLKSNSARILIGVLALFLLFNALTGLGVIELPDINAEILSLAAVLIIFIEIGFVKLFGGAKEGKKGMDLFSAFGAVAAVLLLIFTVLNLTGISSTLLDSIRGVVFAVVFVSFTIEVFVR